MPATAGRVRMPANNRVHSSAALQTHGIWQSAIGYDPYAPNKDDKDASQSQPNAGPDADNAYASFQGLLQLAKITNSEVDVSRGACKKCGRVGHLKFQCKNNVKIKDDKEEKDFDAMQSLGLVRMDKLKGKAEKVDKGSNVESSEEEEDDSESSDSEIDSEIERAIVKRSGKKVSEKRGSYRKKDDSDDDESDKDSDRKRKKRGREKKRSVKTKRDASASDDSVERRRRKKKREHRRSRRDKSPDDSDEYRHKKRKSRKEKRRRRSRVSDSDFETSEDFTSRHKRKSKRTSSSTDSDSGDGYNGSRKGRDTKKIRKEEETPPWR
uniref:CCHC-type domain-containing protein n=1 Tax=Medicago truncatula TaxID=3880 RepID=I3SAF4_MEDTR|nr:unknown [Medicago truncatula]